jgi:hypothetical protein
MKLVLARVGEGPEDGADVLVHDLTKVHGDGEQEDQEKSSTRGNECRSPPSFWREHVKVHPDEGDNGEHADDDSAISELVFSELGCWCSGLMLVSFAEVRCLRRVVTPQWRRDFTVPIGISRMAALSSSDRSCW